MSNETIAEDLDVHKNTIKQLKKDFEEIQILSVRKEKGETDKCSFTRLIKITETKNVPADPEPKQNSSGDLDKKSYLQGQNLSTNINKAEEFKNKEASPAALIRDRLKENGISEYQYRRYFKDSFEDEFLLNKIEQVEFLEKYHPEKFKTRGKGSYLFNSIQYDWQDVAFEKYKNRVEKDIEKQHVVEKEKAREEKQRMTDEELVAACLEYYGLLDAETRKAIDAKIDKEIPVIFREDEKRYRFAFEAEKIIILKELLNERG
jgi:hypothetical protein